MQFRKFQIRKHFLPKRKLFFPIGLISLGLLPLIGFSLLFSDQYFHPLHVMEVTYMSTASRERMRGCYIPTSPAKILIQGNEMDRKQKILELKETLIYLQHRKGESCFQIELGDKSSWNDFVSILNIFHKKGIKRYVVDKNQILVYADSSFRLNQMHAIYISNKKGEKVHDLPLIMLCGGVLNGDLIPSQMWDPPLPNAFQILSRSPRFFLLLLMFVLLLISNIFSIKNKLVKTGRIVNFGDG